MTLIRDLAEVAIADISQVGGKAASLGEMIRALTPKGIRIPHGFVVTTDAYRMMLHALGVERIYSLLECITEYRDSALVHTIGHEVRTLIQKTSIPDELQDALRKAYRQLSLQYRMPNLAVAVRSSATAEDLPTASYAGQQESYLNVRGEEALLVAYRNAVASLFTDRALVYRFEQKIAHEAVALAVCVQKMVDANEGASGVIFTLDPESGFAEVCSVSATYGLGELLVQGTVTPDEYIVYKKQLVNKQYPILRTIIGSKEYELRATQEGTTISVAVSPERRMRQVVTREEVQELVAMAICIETYYTQLHGAWSPQDIEWAKDGTDGLLYIVQARSETVHAVQAHKKQHEVVRYQVQLAASQRHIVAQGQSIGTAVVRGIARLIERPEDAYNLQSSDIIVTRMTDPDWVPAMRHAAAIVTDLGGRTCHAAIVSRELKIPALVGTEKATQKIRDGQAITVDCSQGLQGYVYDGHIPYTTQSVKLDQMPATLRTKLLLNIAQPEAAFAAAALPVSGVGLARLEFIMSQYIGIHPMAVVAPERVSDKKVQEELARRARPYGTLKNYFVTRLAEGIGMIAAAFYPRPVVIRLSDFKTNEYRNLIGGEWFEPHEENPMLGWRGASRYTTPEYTPAFALECEALRIVRETWGFVNVHVMVPFVRSLDEMRAVGELLTQYGLARGRQGLLWYMMVELPVNVILLEQFAELCDAFSIGSNDLTQLVLGVDRDSGKLHAAFDERSEAVKCMMREAICKARRAGKTMSICGEAPSNYPEVAEFLMKEGIDALSLSPDAVISFVYQKTT